MLLIELFWGRRKTIRADMSIFWTFCSGAVLTGMSATVLLLVWQYLYRDGSLEAQEISFLIILAFCLFTGCFISALFGLALAWYLTIHYKRPLNAITNAAQDIASGNLGHRVNTQTNNKELSILIAAFNQMCDQNEKAINELRRAGDNLSHDLKTPLTHMQILTERMAKAQNVQQDLVPLLAKSIAYMKNTIDTVLDISRTENMIDNPPLKPVDLRQTISDIIELYSDIAKNRHIQLSSTLSKEPAIISGNKNRLSRVVAILLDNAFKFTPDGGNISATVSISTSAITLAVSDTGIGIMEDDMPHIFNRFYQSRINQYQTNDDNSQSGHGLGLSLAKAIVESYHGNISAYSIPHQETTFTLSFPPFRLAHPESPGPNQECNKEPFIYVKN